MDLKNWFVAVTGNWFYPVQKLPVGTHLRFFLKHRVTFDLKIVFDVGANIGGFSKEISSLSPKTFFYCFEPFPTTFLDLKNNLPEKEFNLYEFALGDHDSKVYSEINEKSHSDTNNLNSAVKEKSADNQVEIRIQKLDTFLKDKQIPFIDLLKIDTEGFDLKVLQGGYNILKSGRVKLVYIECGLDLANNYHIYFPEILSYLTGLGYVFIGLFQTDIRKIDRKIHFSNALFVHSSFANQIKTYL